MIGIAALLFALWGYVRSDWGHAMRLQLILHGLPFAELRDEPPGFRHPDADKWGMAYRRSVYSRGKYVGCVERFGSYVPEGAEFGNPIPFVVTCSIYQWGQYIAGFPLIVGLFLLARSRRSKITQTTNTKDSQPPAAG